MGALTWLSEVRQVEHGFTPWGACGAPTFISLHPQGAINCFFPVVTTYQPLDRHQPPSCFGGVLVGQRPQTGIPEQKTSSEKAQQSPCCRVFLSHPFGTTSSRREDV